MFILGVGGGSAGGCRAHAQFFCRRRILTTFSPPSLPLPPPVWGGAILYSAYPAFIEWWILALSPLPPPPPRPPAILYSAYQQFDMFLLSSRYNLKFHTFLRGLICLHQSLHIIATAYIIVFIHYTNSSAYSATGYIIVCIQGKASPWFPSGTKSGATRWSSADTVSTWLFLTTIAWQKTPTGPDQTCSRLEWFTPRRIWYTQNFQIFMYIFFGGMETANKPHASRNYTQDHWVSTQPRRIDRCK